MNRIHVIDLFAGPGGLGEGFSRYRAQNPFSFKSRLSIEMDVYAHRTLKLRSFYRLFKKENVPEEYYRHLRGEITLDQLFAAYPHEAEMVRDEVWRAELGKVASASVDNRIRKAIGNKSCWVLIGGPPCQAYSTAGRSRNKGIENYIPENDNRHFLYREYLRIIAFHWPSVFIMENVRGILSSKVNGNLIFERILKDLEDPAAIFNGNWGEKKYRYRIFSLVKAPDSFDSSGHPRYRRIHDFTIKSENFGIPQARHRVILLGIREDLPVENPPILKPFSLISVENVIGDLPRMRSGFSNGKDSPERWLKWLGKIHNEKWMKDLSHKESSLEIYREIISKLGSLNAPLRDRGAEFIPCKMKNTGFSKWYVDLRIGGICNSTTRGHMDEDLYRYFFASCYTKIKGYSPILSQFPEELLPRHKNAKRSARKGDFTDRFRVQAADRPATTVMSHISKDGHYYIHYDPTQCRSLTVREAARLQTFPDNYFFCGPRTQQYVQVGNAVPPLLAWRIAEIVYGILTQNRIE